MSAFTWDPENLPFSFRYGGQPSHTQLPDWDREETDGGQTRHLSFTDPETQLCVRVHLRSFNDFDAFDWVLEFENQGTSDTPIIEDILPLDTSWPVPEGDWAILHYANGSTCQVDDFEPKTEWIRSRTSIRLAPKGGRSSSGVLPFMNLQLGDHGVVLGIGWTGQWAASFERNEQGVCATAGMERTHLRLHPGERIRTPRILTINWEGDDPVRGNTLLRRIILDHYTPRIDGDVVMPPIAHNTQATYYWTGEMDEEGQIAAARRVAELGAEAFWIDAAWFGEQREHREWASNVGNWYYRKDAFPRGLRPVGEAVHESGMEFVLWFEPERAYKGSLIHREHPEFLLWFDQNPGSGLVNLGMPEARVYITDILSRIISESKVDIYRQDYNVEPLPYWQAADAEDRVGITEAKYIEGLYQMWDELRQRHPGLVIDNCSGGGRRIDLETTSRSFPLWRSDFSDIGGPAYGPWLQIGDQVQTAGLSRWVPLHTGAVWSYTPYAFRSAMAAGVQIYTDVRTPEFPSEAARRAIAELKSLRPYYLGDFYPLLPAKAVSHDWCAYQYDRSELGEGFAVFLRRYDSPFPTMEVALQGIDEQAEYEVSLTKDFDEPPYARMDGTELLSMTIEIDDRPGSILLRYRRAR